jgi:hypothetical protein
MRRLRPLRRGRPVRDPADRSLGGLVADATTEQEIAAQVPRTMPRCCATRQAMRAASAVEWGLPQVALARLIGKGAVGRAA